jgi:hypothetical protein
MKYSPSQTLSGRIMKKRKKNALQEKCDHKPSDDLVSLTIDLVIIWLKLIPGNENRRLVDAHGLRITFLKIPPLDEIKKTGFKPVRVIHGKSL